MSVTVKTVVDHERGCGWRKEGGLYMMSSGISVPCGKLPILLDVCPCCSAGIKPARGWTWFNPRPFVEKKECLSPDRCNTCILSTPPDKAGLLWIGEKFYPTPADWTEEAFKLGVSRRVNMIPKGFVIGQTWIFSAHRLAVDSWSEKADPACPLCHGKGETTAHHSACSCRNKKQPGIFHVWKPDRIEYVTTGKETEDELKALVERGITPVKVVRAGQTEMEIKTKDTP